MLTSKQIMKTLNIHRKEIQRFGVKRIGLFGSFQTNKQHKESDIDILVDFEKPVGLFEYARLKMYLEDVLGREVDLVTPEALRKELREDILREAIRAA